MRSCGVELQGQNFPLQLLLYGLYASVSLYIEAESPATSVYFRKCTQFDYRTTSWVVRYSLFNRKASLEVKKFSDFLNCFFLSPRIFWLLRNSGIIINHLVYRRLFVLKTRWSNLPNLQHNYPVNILSEITKIYRKPIINGDYFYAKVKQAAFETKTKWKSITSVSKSRQ